MQIQPIKPPNLYGRDSDEYFVRFWAAKDSNNTKAMKILQNEILSLPTEEKLSLASLIEEIEEASHPKENISIDFSI